MRAKESRKLLERVAVEARIHIERDVCSRLEDEEALLLALPVLQRKSIIIIIKKILGHRNTWVHL